MAMREDMRKYNLGWALLKLWMCYEVVMVHAWNAWGYPGEITPSKYLFVREFLDFAVPVFMLITFFLSAKKFAANDGEWLKNRFVRLLTPFAFWSVLAFVTWRLLAPHFTGFMIDPATGAFWKPTCGHDPVPVSFEYLFLQALGTTRTLGSQMWFQAVLVILTAFFAVFFRLVRPRMVAGALVVLFLVGVMMDYSGLNKWLFEGFRYEVRNPLGRIFPMMPYAALGLFLGARAEAFEGFSMARRLFLVVLGVGVTAFLLKFDVFVTPPGFFYRGLKMLFVALGLVTAFRFLPLERMPVTFQKGLVWASKYSMGVYFVHIYVGRLLEVIVFPHLSVVPRSFSGGCIVFVASFVLCVAIARIPNRWVRSLIM